MLSKTAKYAIRATLYITQHSSRSIRVGVDQIAEELKIPKHFLAKILQVLSKDGIISSIKGPGGGFYMTEENYKKSILEILLSVEKKEVFTGCILGLPVCSDDQPCPLHKNLVGYRDGLYYQLEKQTIGETAHSIKYHGYKI